MTKRDEYMNNKISHREYYAQFVNEGVKQAVLNMFDLKTLKESYAKDEHFNTKLTPIEKWDLLGGFRFSKTTGETLMRPTTTEPINYKLLKEANEGYSSAVAVCIYKEAGKQLIEA